MLTDQDREDIRAIVRLEVENVVRSHLVSLTEAVLAPLMDVQGEILRNQKLIADGQALVERSLADRLPDEDEPWRESFDDGE